jgi:hypothetical protein
VSPEAFRELRHTCLLSRRRAAEYLGVSVRTIRHWDAGRNRVPWSVVRLLRLVRAGELGGLDDAWEGWTLSRHGLRSPCGRVFPVQAMRLWWLTVEQARFWREGYDLATAPAQGAAASEWNERPPVAASAGAAGGADRQGAAAAGSVTPSSCRTALAGLPVARGRAGESPPPREAAGLDGGCPDAPTTAGNRGAAAAGRGVTLASQCSHEAAPAGSAEGGCNMEQTAPVCGFSPFGHVPESLPLANRGGTNLNGTQDGVILASPCKGVA